MDSLFAFSIERASRLTGLSASRLRRWDDTGLYTPELADENRRQAYSRVYSFRDIVALRTLAQLRERGVSVQELRKVGAWLKAHYEHPWSRLRFYLLGKRILVGDPESGDKVTSRPLGQHPLPTIELEAIAQDTRNLIERLQARTSEDFGVIARHRSVQGNAPVLAGTRIPTAAIWEYHAAGYGTAAILDEYPHLTVADIDAAIAAEENQHQLVG